MYKISSDGTDLRCVHSVVETFPVLGHFVALQEYLWCLSHCHGNMVFWLVLLSNLRQLLLPSSKVCTVKSITYTDRLKMETFGSNMSSMCMVYLLDLHAAVLQ